MSGKVYFVAAPGRIKVGFTRKPERRLTALRRADMEELTVIAIIDGERALEKKLHAILAEHQLRGEWFKDCERVREIITEAVAGKHAVAAPVAEEPAVKEVEADDPPAFSHEYQIVQRLFDEAEAAIARGADKYEVRGYANAALAASQAFMRQRGIEV